MISKPYGLKGSVYVIIDPEAAERIQPDIPLFVEIDGQRIPFFVEEFEKVSRNQAIMKLEFIESLDDARKLTGCCIFPEDQIKKSRSSRKYDLQDMVGFHAYDQSGRSLGFVTGYISDAMNPLLLIDQRGKEILIPAAEEIILLIDYKNKLIKIEIAEGLTDL